LQRQELIVARQNKLIKTAEIIGFLQQKAERFFTFCSMYFIEIEKVMYFLHQKLIVVRQNKLTTAKQNILITARQNKLMDGEY
jgi:predicted AAA+ superfamily ATPase